MNHNQLTESVEDTEIWSSEPDWVWDMTDDEIREYSDLSDDEEFDRDDELYYIYNSECDLAHDDLFFDIIENVKKQCYNDYIWFVGGYQRWDGNHDAIGAFKGVKDGIESVCYPSYDAHTRLINRDGNLCFTESSHDAPMGGTMMTLYSFKDADAFNKADADGDVSYDFDDYKTVSEWIKKGWLTPISANIF